MFSTEKETWQGNLDFYLERDLRVNSNKLDLMASVYITPFVEISVLNASEFARVNNSNHEQSAKVLGREVLKTISSILESGVTKIAPCLLFPNYTPHVLKSGNRNVRERNLSPNIGVHPLKNWWFSPPDLQSGKKSKNGSQVASQLNKRLRRKFKTTQNSNWGKNDAAGVKLIKPFFFFFFFFHFVSQGWQVPIAKAIQRSLDL